MDRRGFLGGLIVSAAGLYLPYEPERVYSFASRRFLMEEAVLKKMLDCCLIPPEEEHNQMIEIRKWNDSALTAISKCIDRHLSSCELLVVERSVAEPNVIVARNPLPRIVDCEVYDKYGLATIARIKWERGVAIGQASPLNNSGTKFEWGGWSVD